MKHKYAATLMWILILILDLDSRHNLTQLYKLLLHACHNMESMIHIISLRQVNGSA